MISVNKPPHFVVHPASGHWDDTLVNGLLYHCGVLPETDEIYKPGIVHRIDKDTSGIIVAAKTQRAHGSLTRAASCARSRPGSVSPRGPW